MGEKADQDLVWDIHSSQGAIATETNDPQGCLEHYTVILEMTRQHYSQPRNMDQNLSLSIALNEIGTAYMINDRISDAINAFKEALEIAERYQPFSSKALTFSSLASANMGLAYWLEGRLDDAIVVLTSALKVRERQLGIDDRGSFV